ncbi:MAG: rhodanese-like domain-containing protein [Steroidobacteraceae bacterium]
MTRTALKTLRGTLAGALLACLATPSLAADAWAAAEMSPTDLRAQVAADAGSLVILDVRTPEEFAAGHIPGAINVPHDQVPARLAEFAAWKDKTIVAYCRSGRRVGIALKALHDAGFTKLVHLAGDMPGWSK